MPASAQYRALTSGEIEALKANGCFAEDWKRVEVAEDFAPDRVRSTAFCGDVRLGRLAGRVQLPGGIESPCMIANAALHNCTVGEDCLIRNVRRAIANYDIGSGVVIEDVSSLVVEGESAFGNGVKVEALNEAGGREVKIFDRLSSQIAYILAVYRHRADVIEKIEATIDAYVAGVRSARGTIGDKAWIANCGTIENVRIGPSARIRGAVRLVNGSINSTAADPTTVGDGVIAENFIFSSGSRVDGGAMVTGSFVGQGTRIGRQFSAENSLFFANCEGFHGEACAIFAGPYTVTHHKSTLLIAGLFSFYNAGSGTNQSNHMYKLGPVHQGTMMRGAKTGSFSYMLWPSVAGPYSVVVGKHMTNFDLANLPFSYITSREERTFVTPAMNLFTVGTRRDIVKWPARDRRKDPDRLDLIHFDFYTPWLAEKVLRGMDELTALYENTPKEKEYVTYKGAQIPRRILRTACKYYEIFHRIFLGECLVELIEAAGGDPQAAKKRLAELAQDARDDTWVDAAGLFAPSSAMQGLLDDVAAGNCPTVAHLETRLAKIHAAYADSKLRWFAHVLATREGMDPRALTAAQMEKIVTDWRTETTKLNNMILQDAGKEFSVETKLGFGADGDAAVRDADFEAVRGTFDSNKFVRELKAENERVAGRAEALIAACGGK